MADIADLERQIADFQGDQERVRKLHAGDINTVYEWRALNHDLASAKTARNAALNGERPEGDTVELQDEIERLKADKAFVAKLHSGDPDALAKWQDAHRRAFAGITRGEAAILQSTDPDFHY